MTWLMSPWHLLMMVVPTIPIQVPMIEPIIDQYLVFSAWARSFSCESRTGVRVMSWVTMVMVHGSWVGHVGGQPRLYSLTGVGHMGEVFPLSLLMESELVQQILLLFQHLH